MICVIRQNIQLMAQYTLNEGDVASNLFFDQNSLFRFSIQYFSICSRDFPFVSGSTFQAR